MRKEVAPLLIENRRIGGLTPNRLSTRRFSRKNYLPEALGKFRGFKGLDDRICKECNGRCGREFEDQFAVPEK